MPLITWYLCRRILVLFPAGLVTLTALIWSTQALQRLDLVTAKGQAFGVFMELTLLAIPYLATLLAPIAFVIAMIAVYDALNRDSELVVLASAGAGRARLLRPALLAAFVCAALVAAGCVWAGPAGLQRARVILTDVRADVVTSIVQPGRFIEVDDGLTVHISDRSANGTLSGLLLDDKRSPERTMTYLAQTGQVTETAGNTLLVMTNGTIQRMERSTGELSVAAFDAYAFDLTALTAGPTVARFRPSELTLPELLATIRDGTLSLAERQRLVLEVHDRITQPLAVLVYAMVVFVFVGDPRTYRQGRMVDMLAAVVAVALLKGASFAVLLAAESAPPLVFALYGLLAGVAVLALWVVFGDRSVTVHERIAERLVSAVQRLASDRPSKAAAT